MASNLPVMPWQKGANLASAKSVRDWQAVGEKTHLRVATRLRTRLGGIVGAVSDFCPDNL